MRQKVEKYDQTFKGVTAKGNEANQLQFIVKNNISLKDIQKAYGKDLKKRIIKRKESDSGIFIINILKVIRHLVCC